MKGTKYDFMDCLGDWIKGETPIDLEKNIYDNEIKIEYVEIYKDIPKEARAYKFYAIYFKDESELFIRVKSEDYS